MFYETHFSIMKLCTVRCVLDRMCAWYVGRYRHIHTRGLWILGGSRSVRLDMAVVIRLQALDTEQACPRMTGAALPRRLLHCPLLCTPGCQEYGGDRGSTVGSRLHCSESVRLRTVRPLVPLYHCRSGPSQR